MINLTKFQLKQMWPPMKAIAEMKCDPEQIVKLE